MTVADLRAFIADLPGGMPLAVRGYESGFDALAREGVFVASLRPYVADNWFGPPGPNWFDGDLTVEDGGVPHLVFGTTARKAAD